MTGQLAPSAGGVLEGTRAVVLGGLGPVPFAAMMMADMGADVILIDRPEATEETPLDAVMRRGQRSLAADLKSERDQALVRELVGSSDVLLEGFRPGVAERLGFGPDECLRLNERLVYGRATGWGQDGPWAQAAGHDLNYISIAGVLGAMGSADRVPPPPLIVVGDHGGGGMFLLAGVLGALIERGRSGRGQVIDAAMVDGAALLAAPIFGQYSTGIWRDQRESNLMDGAAPFYRTYRTLDGGHMAVAAVETQFYVNLLSVLEVDDLTGATQWDRTQWPAVSQRFVEEFARRSRADWESAFRDVEACVTPVLGLAESISHAHSQARELYVEADGMTHVAPAPRFGRTPSRRPGRWARKGEHSAEIRSEFSVDSGGHGAKGPAASTV